MFRKNRTGHKNRRYVFGVCVLLALLQIVTLGVSSVFAYMKWQSEENANTFTAASSVDPKVQETFADNEKSNVSVSVGDTGYSVYVRASVVVNWADADGRIYGTAPKGTDYSITYNLKDSGWFRGDDGFYYYASPVESGGSTEVLILSCKPLTEAPEEGYTLDVNIITQTIQAAGTTDEGEVPAVTDAWGVAVYQDGTIGNAAAAD